MLGHWLINVQGFPKKKVLEKTAYLTSIFLFSGGQKRRVSFAVALIHEPGM